MKFDGISTSNRECEMTFNAHCSFHFNLHHFENAIEMDFAQIVVKIKRAKLQIASIVENVHQIYDQSSDK